MNFVDHSKGHTPAKKGDHKNWRLKLYHNKCGERMKCRWNGWTCEGSCQEGYHPNVMDSFNDDAMATRFHIRADPDLAQYVIVWKQDGKKEYSTLVPIDEAGSFERFTL